MDIEVWRECAWTLRCGGSVRGHEVWRECAWTLRCGGSVHGH